MKYKPYKNEFWNEEEAKNLFQILPFYNVLIEKPKIKKFLTFLAVLLTKLCVLIINLVKMLCTEGKMLLTNLLKQILGV